MRKTLLSTMPLLLAFIASPAWTEIERVEMRVDGLACPFCAYGLEKKLKDVPGVSEVEIRVDEGLVRLKAKEGESIDVDRLKPAVKDAGFTPREITATAVGNVATVNERSVLQVSGADTELILDESPTMKELQSKLDGSRRVRLTGRLEERTPEGHHAHPFSMTVEKFEILDSPEE